MFVSTYPYDSFRFIVWQVYRIGATVVKEPIVSRFATLKAKVEDRERYQKESRLHYVGMVQVKLMQYRLLSALFIQFCSPFLSTRPLDFKMLLLLFKCHCLLPYPTRLKTI